MRTFRVCVLLLCFAPSLHGGILGVVRGIVHDPQHRPIAGVSVVLKAQSSEYQQEMQTGQDGEFRFDVVPVGAYSVTVSQASFQPAVKVVTVLADSAPVLHFELKLAPVSQSVQVSEEVNPVIPESATPVAVVDRQQIADTPGADRSNSLAVITDYVPGAYYTHDQLHVRGGHQVSWLIDGIPVPNTNIASNLGPQIDPKDIDTMEVQRGSYAADYGDRTYGVINVIPRTGFERNNLGELVLSAGNFYQSNDQINFGSHTERFAYYASLNGNRSDLGLQTPVSTVVHDRENGFGGFGTLIFNVDPQNQLRLVGSARRDFYQIPYDPNDPVSNGLRDADIENDVFFNLSWARTFQPGMLLTVSPFYHYNRANYDGNPNDLPISTTDDRASTYAGGQASLGIVNGKHNARVGFYGFAQRDNQLFGLIFNDLSNPNFRDQEKASGSLEVLFAEEQYKFTSWLTLSGGVRQTHFAGGVVENDTSPRVGASLRIPKLNWTFRGFYGHFYQAPPLITASGPLLQFVNSQDLGFIPLHGERDEESQFGVTMPWKGWTLDADTFRTRARNFFDHNNVGNSNVFFPLTIDGALIRGWELTLHSPRIAHRAQIYLTYANQIALGRGAISGGLTDFSPPSGYFLLDHDQRNTLHVGGTVNLSWRSYVSTDVYYGSGFTDGDAQPGGPDHLPGHTTFDLSLGKEFGESFSVSLNGLNVANRSLLLDNSLTFGGTHSLYPREIYVQLRYRFHY
jgi:TonB dependent receptor/Carboxypeptidase regulatory-like domain/TonB-dependent Receptor Plug Domain